MKEEIRWAIDDERKVTIVVEGDMKFVMDLSRRLNQLVEVDTRELRLQTPARPRERKSGCGGCGD